MENNIHINYDKDSEVLYIAKGKPVPALCEEGASGLLYRFAISDNQPCGVTVVSSELWYDNIHELSLKVASFLSLPLVEVENAIITEMGKNART